jgi:hypothetical protein
MNDATTQELREPVNQVAPTPAENDGWDWGIVEIFGHRRHAGRVREEERFGTKMLRVDVPVKGDPVANGWETHWYGGASIFSFALTNEDIVMRANKPYASPSRFLAPPDEEPESDDDEVDDGVPYYGADEPALPAELPLQPAAPGAES